MKPISKESIIEIEQEIEELTEKRNEFVKPINKRLKYIRSKLCIYRRLEEKRLK